jgi:acetyl-CoA acyltransferase 2
MSVTKSGKIYLVDGRRTPFGRFGGSLKNISPVDLAVHAGIKLTNALGLLPARIDHVILGNVVPSTTDTIYGARHLALKMGCPDEVAAYGVNRLCGSGVQSMADGCRLIKTGEAQIVLAGGSENMSLTPHLVYGSRFGTKYGSLKTVDMLLDSLTDQHAGCSMGVTAENLGERYSLTREECDAFALQSHVKAAAAYEKGKFAGELVSIETKRGIVSKDEHLRADATLEDMQKLSSSFKKNGLVTAANASGIVDGAALSVVASEEACEQMGWMPLAEIVDYFTIGVDPKFMGIGPVPVIQNLMERSDLSKDQIDLFEINEAFAPQALACIKELAIDSDKVNIWGGAIALGHPLGATGTRISLTLARQLKDEGKKYGIASACIGGGQGIGMLLRSV